MCFPDTRGKSSGNKKQARAASVFKLGTPSSTNSHLVVYNCRARILCTLCFDSLINNRKCQIVVTRMESPVGKGMWESDEMWYLPASSHSLQPALLIPSTLAIYPLQFPFTFSTSDRFPSQISKCRDQLKIQGGPWRMAHATWPMPAISAYNLPRRNTAIFQENHPKKQRG